MRFDVCLMNPPYQGDFHIQFINKCIECCDTIINISPSNFIEEVGTYINQKEHAEIAVKHLDSYEILEHRYANDVFKLANGIIGNLHIGIYKNNKTDGKPAFSNDILNLYCKIRFGTKRHLRNLFISKDKLSANGLRIFRYHYNPNEPTYKNIICYDGKAKEGIDFKSMFERDNFIESLKTKFYNFIYTLDENPAHLPYMEDYCKKWSDEDYYNFFDLSTEEIDIIEKFDKGKIE